MLSLSSEVEKRARAVAEGLDGHPHPLGEREMQIAERPLAVVGEVAAAGKRTAAAAGQEDWQIIRVMGVAVRDARPTEDHRRVEQRVFPFGNLAEPLYKPGKLLDMPAGDPPVLLELLGLPLVV